MAFLPVKARNDLIARLPFDKRTPRTIVKPSTFRQELARVRIAGFAIDDEEFEEGLRCVGAPIFDHRGRVIASISIAAPIFRLRKDRLAGIARIVMAAAEGFSADLGSRTATDGARRRAAAYPGSTEFALSGRILVTPS